MDQEAAAEAGQPNLKDFYTDERRRLVGYTAKRFTGRDGTESEDVVQDVFLAVLERALNPIENWAAYVYRSIDNRITDLFRRRSRQTLSLDELEDTLGGHALDAILEDLTQDVESGLERRENLAALEKAMAKLPSRDRAILVATEIEGRTFQDLADEWEEPLGTLLSRKYRAVQKLKNLLKRQIAKE